MAQEVHTMLQFVALGPLEEIQHYEVPNNNIYHTYIRTT